MSQPDNHAFDNGVRSLFDIDLALIGDYSRECGLLFPGDDLLCGAERHRRSARHAIPIRASGLLLRGQGFDPREARLQPHGDFAGYLG